MNSLISYISFDAIYNHDTGAFIEIVRVEYDSYTIRLFNAETGHLIDSVSEVKNLWHKAEDMILECFSEHDIII